MFRAANCIDDQMCSNTIAEQDDPHTPTAAPASERSSTA